MGAGRRERFETSLAEQAEHGQALKELEPQHVPDGAFASENVLGDEEPEQGAAAPSAGSPKPLAQAGNGPWGRHLGYAVHTAYVDAEFQGLGADSGCGLAAFLQAFFKAEAQVPGEAPVMREKFVVHALFPAQGAQASGDLFGAGTGVGEDEIVLPPEKREEILNKPFVTGSLVFRPRRPEMVRVTAYLNDRSGGRFFVIDDDAGVIAPSRTQEVFRFADIAQRGAQGNTRHGAVHLAFDPFQEGLCLPAAFPGKEVVKLVNDNAAEIAECGPAPCVVPHEERFKGFRGDEQNAARTFQEVPFGFPAGVAVPGSDGNARVPENAGEALSLIVDEGLERAQAEGAQTAGGLCDEERADGQKGRFCFA